MSYLICQKCGGYPTLKEGYKLENFECGGAVFPQTHQCFWHVKKNFRFFKVEKTKDMFKI